MRRKKYQNQFISFDDIDDQSQKTDFRVEQAQIKKKLTVATVATIFVRFPIHSQFWKYQQFLSILVQFISAYREK